MGVYVDHARHKYRSMIMCHMIADTLPELHAMADKIGVKRMWFQDKRSMPHYDISLSKKSRAIINGAVLIDNRKLVELMQLYRQRRDGKN